MYAKQILNIQVEGQKLKFDLLGRAGELMKLTADIDVVDLTLREANLEETFLDLYSKEPVNE